MSGRITFNFYQPQYLFDIILAFLVSVSGNIQFGFLGDARTSQKPNNNKYKNLVKLFQNRKSARKYPSFCVLLLQAAGRTFVQNDFITG